MIENQDAFWESLGPLRWPASLGLCDFVILLGKPCCSYPRFEASLAAFSAPWGISPTQASYFYGSFLCNSSH